MKKQLLGIALGVALAPFASAANFTFTGLGSVPSGGYTTTNGGITVTVTAASGGLGYYNLDGIGVKDGFFDLPAMGDNQTLNVNFSTDVTIGSLRMRQWEGPDKVQLASAGGNLTLDAETAPFDTNETFDLSSLGPISSFTLTGDSFGTQTLLAALNDVQEVPLPAAAWLFGSAVLGLGGVARRKRKQ
jgi:hypothetical protein